MKFVCINNSLKEKELTIGKIYYVPDYAFQWRRSPTIPVINNLGEVFNYVDTRFVSLDEWRSQQINKIINE